MSCSDYEHMAIFDKPLFQNPLILSIVIDTLETNSRSKRLCAYNSLNHHQLVQTCFFINLLMSTSDLLISVYICPKELWKLCLFYSYIPLGVLNWWLGDQGGSKESPCLANLAKPQYGLNIISNVWTNSKDKMGLFRIFG